MSRNAGMVAGYLLVGLILGGSALPPSRASAAEFSLLPDSLEPVPVPQSIYPLDKSEFFFRSLHALSGADQGLKPEDLKLDFDFPLVYHPRVEFWLHYFSAGEGREVFARWLGRSGRYETMIRQILRTEGLPEDLIYLAMIESGFNPAAYSRARAAGVWQFIPSTGRMYGLHADWWADERRDPEKATWSAVHYLHDLYRRFGCWHLAAASYNAGEGKIQHAIDTYETEDYWELLDYSYLRNETKDYLPKMIAAAIIAKNPERFGFTDVALEPPVEYETVKVNDATDLRMIARWVGATYPEIKRLNPDLLRWCTPPGQTWQVKVPKGTAESFQIAYAQTPASERVTFRRHVVHSGETLSQIAKRYHTNTNAIMQLNGIKSVRKVRVGQSLIIPVPAGEAPPVVAELEPRPSRKTSSHHPAAPAPPPKGAKKVAYSIRSGDTLWAVAQAYGVTVEQIKSWNGIQNHHNLKPGNTLTLYSAQPKPVALAANTPAPAFAKDSITYTVRPGDNLWTIAQRYRLRTEDIQNWNSLEHGHVLQPGDLLRLRMPAKP